jgi:hypothetical protein
VGGKLQNAGFLSGAKNNNPKLVHYERVYGNESLSDNIDNISDNVFAQL